MVPEIDGRTGIFVQLAHPIGHIRTPQMLNQAFVDRGIRMVALAIDVLPEDLETVVAGLRGWRNLVGIGVTMPYKGRMLGLVDEATEAAKEIGAINIARREPDGRIIGNNGDGQGFVDGLRKVTMDPAGRSVMLVGIGGAGRAIAFGLCHAGVRRLALVNRTPAAAHTLAGELTARFEGLDVTVGDVPDPTGYDLVINATPLGMQLDQPAPVLVDRLDPATTVADIIMVPSVTPLMQAAEARGCTVHPGRPMMEAQMEIFMDFLRLEELYGASADA